MKYHHTGIPTQTPREDEIYVERFDFYCTDYQSNPYGIQWMRYGMNCNLPNLVKEVAHVAFEVDNLRDAIKGKEVIIEPNSPSNGVVVAFIVENGAPVEFLEFEKK